MDKDTTVEALVERLARVERQSRRVRLLSIGLGVVLGVVLLNGQAKPGPVNEKRETLEAERILIRDPDGQARIELGADREHGPFLHMLDAQGTKRITLQLRDDYGHGLIFRNPQGVELAYYSREAVRFIDDHQKLRCYLQAAENLIHGEVVNPPDAYGLTLYDGNGKLRLKAGYPRAGTVLKLFDENGKETWSAGSRPRP